MEQEIAKGGECYGLVNIDRGSAGLVVWVKMDPRIEEFMKNLSPHPERAKSLSTIGGIWKECGDPIFIYPMDEAVEDAYYTLNMPSHMLGGAPPNISFLRIVGISNPEGVRFMIRGPVSEAELKSIYQGTIAGIRRFLKHYVVPIHVTLRISAQELIG